MCYLEVSCKGDQITSAKLTTDRQTVNYYSTMHALKLIYIDDVIKRCNAFPPSELLQNRTRFFTIGYIDEVC